MRWALGVEYDGSSFCGWQSQSDGNTVQDALERAISNVSGERTRVVCAGRTDAGVHATAQVVHIDVAASRPANAWVRGTNSFLPPSVAVTWATGVPDDFHARFSAISRSYCYLLWNSPIRPALYHGQIGWYHLPLDSDVMNEAAALLVGEHDFSAFRSAQCQARSPLKHMHEARVEQCGELFRFEFRASAFLHHMVRNIVGALVYVGKGKHSPDYVGRLLANGDRRQCAPTFSPAGLYLSAVEYEPHWRLPEKGRIIGASLLHPV